MSLPSHHPGDALLIDYAGGALSEGAALAVATHLAFCPGCRRTAVEMEAVGGALLDGLEPENMSPDCLDAVFARIDGDRPPGSPLPSCRPVGVQPAPTVSPRPPLPEPLRGYLPGGTENGCWRFLQRGMRFLEIAAGRTGTTRLIRMTGGVVVPRHTHGEIELTVVLEGGFSDASGRFQPGDIAVGDPSIDHRPVSDPEGCLCLAATVGGLRLTGPVGRLFSRFVTF